MALREAIEVTGAAGEGKSAQILAALVAGQCEGFSVVLRSSSADSRD